jgi:hypothetical protein
MNHEIDFTAPAVIAFVSSLSVTLFEQPPVVFITALGGALWAIWRADRMSFKRTIGCWLGAAMTACALVAFAIWFLNLIGISPPPVRGLAGIIAFLIIDKPWRDRVINFFAGRLDGVGK